MRKGILLLLAAFCLQYASSAPVNNNDDYNTAVAYFIKFKYLTNTTTPENLDPVVFQNLLKLFQGEFRLNITGHLDAETMEVIRAPRCGGVQVNLTDYSLQGTRWRKISLTYRITQYPLAYKMAASLVDDVTARAFQTWADVTPLTFSPTYSGEDITILFASGFHGDFDPFDGPGGTLGHASFPNGGGFVHLDGDEYFTDKSYSGINLYQVITHEIGHALGLEHSLVLNSLMYPAYRSYRPGYILDTDDINGIQALYGSHPSATPAPVPNYPDNPVASPSYCWNPQLDDMITLQYGVTYGFKGNQYYQFAYAGLVAGYPRYLSDWQNLPSDIDAAFSIPAYYNFQFPIEEIWFFKGADIYKYNKFKTFFGRVSIASTIRGLPNDIDTIFIWGGNNYAYAFKGTQYYRLEKSLASVSTGYPRNITDWTSGSLNNAIGINSGIDAANKYDNGKTYFFVGKQYYRFTDSPLKVDSDFPRKTALWWFDCGMFDYFQHHQNK